jgi:predicted RND superfamily exporter protein
MLAIIFGLSSDHEVFAVSRIKEESTKNGGARRAVQRGTALPARVVTAAALIMFSIFAAFMFTSDPAIKAIGFSFAAGVFQDAFVVRLTLIPAAMAIIGSRIWYHPHWFARRIPDPDIEGQRLEDHLTRGELVSAGTRRKPRLGYGAVTPAWPVTWREPVSRAMSPTVVAAAALAALPAAQSEVIMLVDLLDLAVERTARQLGIGVRAAKSRLHRARRALAVLLGQPELRTSV